VFLVMLFLEASWSSPEDCWGDIAHIVVSFLVCLLYICHVLPNKRLCIAVYRYSLSVPVLLVKLGILSGRQNSIKGQ
jgi:hypothetical protein